MLSIGIDPSLRHTGLCLLSEGAEPLFYEIKTLAPDILSAGWELEGELKQWLKRSVPPFRFLLGQEKMLISGWSSNTLFHVQMIVLKMVQAHCEGIEYPFTCMPLPVQLKAYMRDMHKVSIKDKTSIVRSFKEQTGIKGMSSHCAEAYYLARLVRDVYEGRWSYKLSKDLPIIPWEVLGGKQPAGNNR